MRREYRRRAAELLVRRGAEPIDPMRRDYRGRTAGKEAEIVEGDIADIDRCGENRLRRCCDDDD